MNEKEDTKNTHVRTETHTHTKVTEKPNKQSNRAWYKPEQADISVSIES